MKITCNIGKTATPVEALTQFQTDLVNQLNRQLSAALDGAKQAKTLRMTRYYDGEMAACRLSISFIQAVEFIQE